jgi:hypothetical protein
MRNPVWSLLEMEAAYRDLADRLHGTSACWVLAAPPCLTPVCTLFSGRREERRAA